MRLVCSIIFLGLIGSHDLSAVELLVRKKSSSAQTAMRFMEPGLSSSNQTERLEFKSEEEKENYIQNLNPDEAAWEENQVYSGTDYELTSELQAQVQNDVKADPLFASQWSIFPISQDPTKVSGVDIDAVRAWTVTTGSDNIIIYVMDSGIVKGPEPDLINRVVTYYDGLNPGQFPDDENGHGTHVTSIIAAIGANDYGIRGMVPGKVQIGSVRFLNATNQGTTDIAIKGIEFIINDYQTRLKSNPNLHCITSHSWDGGYSQFLADDFKKLADIGCFNVLSAGNNGRNNDQAPDYPCNFQDIKDSSVCVGATDDHDKRANFSSYGPKSVDLYAPGVGILGIVRGSMQGNQWVSARESKSGTSQAVPHITGVAALAWSANDKLTNKDIRNILISTVDKLPGADAEVMSGGRANAYRAVLMASGQDTHLADRNVDSSSGGGGCTLKFSQSNSAASRELFLWGLGFAILCLVSLRFSAVAQSRFGKNPRVHDRQQNAFGAKNP